jgi:hypothetical protein
MDVRIVLVYARLAVYLGPSSFRPKRLRCTSRATGKFMHVWQREQIVQTLPWFCALVEVFRSVPAVPNITVRRPVVHCNTRC